MGKDSILKRCPTVPHKELEKLDMKKPGKRRFYAISRASTTHRSDGIRTHDPFVPNEVR